MALAKGTNLLNARAFVQSRWGDAGWTRVTEAMTPADRAALGTIVAVGWYDLELQLRVVRAIDGALGNGDLGLVWPLGRFEAEQDLTRIHRMFLRLANPAYVLEKAGEYWGRFYDSGAWTVTREGSNRASGTLSQLSAVDVAFCVYLTAYIGRMFELVGARMVHVEHPRCRGRGDDACVFAGRWQ